MRSAEWFTVHGSRFVLVLVLEWCSWGRVHRSLGRGQGAGGRDGSRFVLVRNAECKESLLILILILILILLPNSELAAGTIPLGFSEFPSFPP
jgi:hypothetical protein